jgi:hypothetical protein
MVGYQQKMSSNAKEKIVLRDLLLLFIFVAIMALSIAIAKGGRPSNFIYLR